MSKSFAALQAKGKSADDVIFAASAAAMRDIAENGPEKVVNGTIGAIMDEEGKLVCLPTVEKVYRSLPTVELAAYAPIAGLPEFLDKVLEATFGKSRPHAHISAVATAGGTGGIHHAIWNYTRPGDVVLTSDWFWGAYTVLCKDLERTLDTYPMLTADERFNLEGLEEKVRGLLEKQDSVLLILNTPAHNPTGYSVSREDLDRIIAMLSRVSAEAGKQAVLFLDVAYLDYAGDKDEVRTMFRALDDLPENLLAIVQYSMSKGFTMYGQRVGAMIGVARDKEAVEEFFEINQYSCRSTWSNICRPAMRTLAEIYSDPELLRAVEAERDGYYKMIKARADIFVKEAKDCGLPMIPYVAGFFLSIPCEKAAEICELLHEDHIYLVPMKAGIRIALCSIPLRLVPGMAEKIKRAMDKVAQR